MFNECAVSVWNGGNVLELTGGDDSTTMRPNLIPLSVHLTQSKVVTFICSHTHTNVTGSLDLRNMSDVEMFEKWRKRWDPQWQKISKWIGNGGDSGPG